MGYCTYQKGSGTFVVVLTDAAACLAVLSRSIQYFRGGYGHVELGPMMACIMMVVIPIVIMYILCQKYIIDGVVAGAVKG